MTRQMQPSIFQRCSGRRDDYAVKTLLLPAIFAFATGCSILNADRPFSTQTEWYHPAEAVRIAGSSDTVVGCMGYPVREAMSARAINMLSEREVVALTSEQAQALSGASLPILDEGSSWYLARGVRLVGAGGGFSVTLYRTGDLVIRFSAHGDRPLPMTNAPVLVGLPDAPKTVYNQVSLVR